MNTCHCFKSQSFRLVGFATIVMGTACYCRITEDTEHPAKDSVLFFTKLSTTAILGGKVV